MKYREHKGSSLTKVILSKSQNLSFCYILKYVTNDDKANESTKTSLPIFLSCSLFLVLSNISEILN